MNTTLAPWAAEVLVAAPPDDGRRRSFREREYRVENGILRSTATASETQTQTAEAFGFKWHQRDSFERDVAVERMRSWLVERYGDVENADWWREYSTPPVILDVGCGAALSSLALFGSRLQNARFIATDISRAVDVAADRCREQGVNTLAIQEDLSHLPLGDAVADVVFAEGVLHHTDSTRDALLRVSRHLKPGGRFMFYVYKTKGPIREFTDDYIRDRLAEMAPEDAWKAIEPLTRLGQALGELDIEIDVPEAIDVLDIPAGRYNLQRFFYWHVAKAYYRPELSFEEMNHINYDWYAPANAHRQTPEEVRAWCDEASLTIEHERIEEAGITIIAKKGT